MPRADAHRPKIQAIRLNLDSRPSNRGIILGMINKQLYVVSQDYSHHLCTLRSHREPWLTCIMNRRLSRIATMIDPIVRLNTCGSINRIQHR